MAKRDGKERVLVLLGRLERVHRIGAQCAAGLHEAVRRWDDFDVDADMLANLLGSRPDPTKMFSEPMVDVTATTVTWHGRTCKLGPSILFRFMDRLVRRPGQYLTLDRLMRDVWEGQIVSDAAIRSAVKRLKIRLTAAGMKGLAVAIRCERRHYYLDAARLKQPLRK